MRRRRYGGGGGGGGGIWEAGEVELRQEALLHEFSTLKPDLACIIFDLYLSANYIYESQSDRKTSNP